MIPESASSTGLTSRCHGSGMLICRCMGDGCCCGWHGYAECPGCKDCEWSDEDPDFYADPQDDDPA